MAISGGTFGSAEWPRRNLHTDAAKAAEAGLPAPIASGIQCEGDIVRLLIRLFDEQWFSHGKLNVTHRRPVFEGTWIQAHARVGATTLVGQEEIVHVDGWCGNRRNSELRETAERTMREMMHWHACLPVACMSRQCSMAC